METTRLKKRRGLGELGTIVIAALFAVLIITAGTLFYGGILTRYGIGYNDTIEGTGASAAYSSLNSSVSKMGVTLKESQSMPAGGVFYVMFQGAFSAVQILFDSIGILVSFIFGTGAFIGAIVGVNIAWLIGILATIAMVFIVWRLLEGGTGRQW